MDTVTLMKDDPCRFQKKLIIGGPVTCVVLPSKAFCWVAKGCFLEKYSLDGSQRHQKYVIFPDGGTIHGVRQQLDTIAVFGGRKVSLWMTKQNGEADTLTKLPLQSSCEEDYILASDWVWDLKIAQTQNDPILLRLALGLANDASEIWTIDKHLSAQRTHKIKGATCCITYSMSFYGWNDNSTELILASGTVFHEILLWNVVDATDDLDLQGKIVINRQETHRLKGHQGVILSVQFSEDGKLLGSTSDDRSVRLWKYSNNVWNCAWVSWGHSARVWSVAFSSVGLITTAEDASARIWNLENGEQLGEIRSYTCQSLWRVAVFENWALIGGNDGSAKLFDLTTRTIQKSTHMDHAFATPMLVPDDRIKQITPEAENNNYNVPKEMKKKAKPKKKNQMIFGMQFCVIQGCRCLLVTTRAGSTFSLSVDERKWSEMSPWWVPSLDGILASDGSCIAVQEKSSSVLVGTTSGNVLLAPFIDENDKSRLIGTAHKYKAIQGVSWIDTGRFVTMHIMGIVKLWAISPDDHLLPKRIFNTSLGAIPTCCCVDRRGHLVVGDSRGNLIIFQIDGREKAETEILPLSLGSKFHKKEHVNAIVSVRDCYLSVGNDGCVHESSWDEREGFQRKLSVPCAPLSGLTHIWVNHDGAVIVAGYHGNIFIALDRETGYEILRVDTGGRQRNLACFVSPGGFDIGICATTKDGRNEFSLHGAKTINNKGSKPLQCNLGTTLHGEPVFDVSFFQSRPDADYIMLLTGSEDCTSKVLVIQDDAIVHSCLLPPQESCIRAVSSSRHPNTDSTLLCICGGKRIVQFYLLVDTTKKNTVTTDFEVSVSFLKVGQSPSIAFVDHRINAVCSIPIESQDGYLWHIVATGDSNGCVNIFIVSERTQLQSAVQSYVLAYNLHTVLALQFLRVEHHILLFAGMTSGEISVWQLSNNRQRYGHANFHDSFICSYKAHQSGTNSIYVQVVSTDEWETIIHICSGGDDQAITLCRAASICEKSAQITFEIRSIRTMKEASNSAIKGVALTLDNKVLSVGYCQRLALWELNDDCELNLLSSTPIDVADVNCLSHCVFAGGVAGQDRILAAIGGEGVELQQFYMS